MHTVFKQLFLPERLQKYKMQKRRFYSKPVHDQLSIPHRGTAVLSPTKCSSVSENSVKPKYEFQDDNNV